MAVAHQASTTFLYTGNTPPQSFSHTHTGNYLLIWISCTNTTGTLASAPTYNGVAATLIDTRNATTAPFLWCYEVIAPAAGAHNVSFAMGGAPNDWRVTASSYSGVDQAAPRGTNAKSTGSDTDPQTTVTSAVGEYCADGMAWLTSSSLNTATLNTSGVQRFNNTSADQHGLAGSNDSGASSVLMKWTLQASRNWVIIGVPLKPSSGADAVAVPAYSSSTSVRASGTGTSLATSVGLNVPTGALIVVAIMNDAATAVSSLQDTAGNTFINIPAASATSGGTIRLELWYAFNAIAHASDIFTATYGGTVGSRAVAVAVYTGAGTSDPLDAGNAATGTSASPIGPSGNVTTAVINELLVGATSNDFNDVTGAGTNFVLREATSGSAEGLQDRGGSGGYLAIGTYNSTAMIVAAGSGKWVNVVAAFKPLQAVPYRIPARPLFFGD